MEDDGAYVDISGARKVLLHTHDATGAQLFGMDLDESTRQKYCSMMARIAEDARRQNFHATTVGEHNIRATMNQLNFIVLHHKVGRIWALCSEREDWVEVNFIFVEPAERRKGHFRRLIEYLSAKRKRIILCTASSEMVKALHALGFHVSNLVPASTRSDNSLMFVKDA